MRVGLGPSAALSILRSYGAAGLIRRTVHEARRALGWYRLTPKHGVRAEGAASDRRAFQVDGTAFGAAVDPQAAIERADRVLGGEYQAFRDAWRRFPTGEGWHRHPVTGVARSPDRQWWRRNLLDPTFGDIKDLWEPARFGWVYDLVRGYLITRNPRYRAAFVERFADWWATNPPMTGPHWSCGQETAIRAIALLYAEANLDLGDDGRTVIDALGASGERIRDAIGYALSQRNNHGLSEAVGLLAIGDRLGARHPEADSWYRIGRRLVDRLVKEQFAEDGWYCQHSFVYMRLAIDQYIVASQVLRGRAEEWAPVVVDRLRAAHDLLGAVVEPETGAAPNYGPSDGAFVHPITMGAYRDFRPTLTALAACTGAAHPAGISQDREVLAWLGRPEPSAAPETAMPAVRLGSSGWAVLRGGEYFVFLRAGRYRFRPGHFDPLQLDVRVGPVEVLTDPGTFRYGGAPPWRNPLVGPDVHNGPALLSDRRPVKGPRFLWLRWPRAAITSVREDSTGVVVVAQSDDGLEREIRVSPDGVTVQDRSRQGSGFRVAWLLHPGADPSLVSSDGADWRGADDGSPLGWFSPAYGVKVASRYFVSECSDGGSLVLRIGKRD